MGNQAAIKVHTHHGEEVICEERARIYNFEMATMAGFFGCLARSIWAEDGILRWSLIAPHVRFRSDHRPRTDLIALENTSNIAGGSVYPVQVSDEISDRAHKRGLPVHLDGARIFSASVASGCSVVKLTRKFDSVMFCLSEGLGAPVGSMLVGSKARAQDDGRGNAPGGSAGSRGVSGLGGESEASSCRSRKCEVPGGGSCRHPRPQDRSAKVVTNTVLFDVSGTGLAAPEVSRRLAAHGVLANPYDQNRIRMVTHYDVDRAGCVRALRVSRDVVSLRA